MRRLAPLLLALALAGSVALQPTEPAAEPCPHEGWPGGYYPYCIGGDPSLVVRSMAVPDGTVLYEVAAGEARYGELLRFRPVWSDIKTQALQAMPEAEVWTWRPTAESHQAALRFPVAWPEGDGLWGPDLVLLEEWLTWLPLVE